jgi:hypothetical protein
MATFLGNLQLNVLVKGGVLRLHGALHSRNRVIYHSSTLSAISRNLNGTICFVSVIFISQRTSLTYPLEITPRRLTELYRVHVLLVASASTMTLPGTDRGNSLRASATHQQAQSASPLRSCHGSPGDDGQDIDGNALHFQAVGSILSPS